MPWVGTWILILISFSGEARFYFWRSYFDSVFSFWFCWYLSQASLGYLLPFLSPFPFVAFVWFLFLDVSITAFTPNSLNLCDLFSEWDMAISLFSSEEAFALRNQKVPDQGLFCVGSEPRCLENGFLSKLLGWCICSLGKTFFLAREIFWPFWPILILTCFCYSFGGLHHWITSTFAQSSIFHTYS